MADSIRQVVIGQILQVYQTIDLGIDGVDNEEQLLQIANLAKTLRPSGTTPTVTKAWRDQITIGGSGTETLDLTALDRGNVPAVTFAGLYIICWLLVGAADNSVGVTMAPASVTPYDFSGGAGDVWRAMPDGGIAFGYAPANTETVSSGVRDQIDLSGTTGDTVEILLVAGA